MKDKILSFAGMGIKGRSSSDPLITHLSPTNHPLLQKAWKYTTCMLLALLLGVGNMWAADPTLSFGTTSVTTSTFLDEYSTEGITISSDRSYLSNCVELGSTPSSYTTYYLQVLSASEAIDSIHVLMSGNGSSKNLRSPMFGWATEANSATADTYSFPAAQTTTGNGYAYAKWFKFDLTGASVKCARLFRSSKNVSSVTPEYTGSSTALGNGQTIKIYGMKIWLHPAAKTDPTITFNNGAYTVGGALDLSTLFDSNSDGAVTYTVKTDGGTSASIVGTSFSAYAAGTAVVTASQAATSTFNAATKDANIVVSVPSTPTHSISYTNLKGSDVSTYPTEYYEGTGIASFDALDDVENFHFNGWNPSSIGDDAITDIEVVATWVAAYDVTFSAGAGSGTVPAKFQKWEGAKFELPGQGEMVAPSGKAFDGWKANGTGDKLAAGAEYTMSNAAVAFVAQWKATPTVLFHWRADAGTLTTDSGNGTTTGGTTTLRSMDTGKTWSSENPTYDATVPADMKATSTKELKSGGNALYLELSLASGTFQEGDTIYVTGYKPWGFTTTTESINTLSTWSVAEVSTGSNASDVKTGYAVIGAGIDAATIYARRKEGSGSGIAAIKVIRPAAREIASTVITLSDVKVNDASISATDLTTLTTNHTLALTEEFAEAPVIKFNEHTVITYTEGEPATKTTDKVYTVTATVNGDGKWQAQQTINEIAYTVTAEKVSAATVTYYDGTTKLGEETVAINGNPAKYADYQDKDFATFVGWYSNADLADEHAIADITALIVTKDTTLYGKWTPDYASSINIEQWVLDHGVSNSPFRAKLTELNYKYATLNNLDSLNDNPDKPYRNYAYLGQKVNKTDSEISFLLKSGSTLNVRFGHLGSNVNVVIGSADPVELTSAEYANDAPGNKVYTYTATEDVVVKFQCTGTSTVVFKQIMIDEAIAEVKLPANVTIDANGGTHADDGKVLKYTGTPLVIGDATPADDEHLFDGWYDGETKIDAAAYVPTKNVTLVAKYVLKPSPFSLTTLTYQVGSGAVTPVGYVEGTYTYSIELPYAKSYDAITVDATLKEAGSSIVEGAVMTVTSLPGAATFTVSDGAEGTQLYTINFKKGAKDGVEIIHATHTGAKTADVTGTIGGEADKNTEGEGKLGGADNFFGIKLAEGTFQSGDILKIHATTPSAAVRIYSDKGTNRINAEDGVFEEGLFTYTLTSATEWIYLYRKTKESETDMNPTVDYMAVYRPMDPVLTAIKFNDTEVAVTGTTVAATLPHGTKLNTMTVNPTIAWNGAGTAEVTGSWAWGANTFTVTDKDGDATVYTITLTEDVEKFTVTYYDGSTELGTEQVEVNEHPTAAEIVAPKKLGKTHIGWSENSEATSATDLNTITRTSAGDVSLYAIYAAIDCPTSGVVFSMEVKANELDADLQPNGNTIISLEPYATINGGEAKVGNFGGSKHIRITKGTSVIQFTGSNAFMYMLLDCQLQEGDTIKLTNTEKFTLSIDSLKTKKADVAKNTHFYVVPATWAGADTILVWHNGNNVSFSSLQVIRPVKYQVSFDLKEHGSPIANMNVIGGSKITAPTAPTDEDYSFGGWYKETTLENEWDFDVDVVEAATILYAKWVDKSDATLKSLAYGETAIELVADQYTYNVTLPSLTSSVPALAAETNNPNATKLIANGTFDGAGNATSTVTVTPEAGADKVYTVNFARGVALEQATVTASTEWDWSAAGVTAEINNDNTHGLSGNDVVIANVPGVNNDADFNSQALKASGTNAIRTTYFQGKELNIKTDKEGLLIVDFCGTNNNARVLKVYDNADNEVAAWNYNNGTRQVQQVVVPAGNVTLKAFEGDAAQNARIYNLKYYALAYTRDDSWIAPGELGTVCYPNGLIATGAEMYQMAGVDENRKFVFDEVTELEPGIPYLFRATSNGPINFYRTLKAPAEAGKSNGMVGTFSAMTIDAGTPNVYYFADNKFYAVSADADLSVPANRAYVDLNTPAPAGAPKQGVRRIVFDVQSEQVATGIGDVQGDEVQSSKVLINGQLFILRGEKMYDATGRLVK